MSVIRTLRKPPLLTQIMQASGGVHARAALAIAMAEVLTRLGAWRALTAPARADWDVLSDACAEIIGPCDPEDDTHLLRAAQLLCDYVDRTRDGPRAAAIGVLFIN
ncbi:MAG: hypothetical protein PSX79_10340, partial [bacterium]|nr:hypothetical protein [bacterium]